MSGKKSIASLPQYTPVVDPLFPTEKFGLLQSYKKAQEYLESIILSMGLEYEKNLVGIETQRPDPVVDFVTWLKYDIKDPSSEVSFVVRFIPSNIIDDDIISDGILQYDHVYHITVTVLEPATNSTKNSLRFVKLFHGVQHLLLQITPDDDRLCEEGSCCEVDSYCEKEAVPGAKKLKPN